MTRRDGLVESTGRNGMAEIRNICDLQNEIERWIRMYQGWEGVDPDLYEIMKRKVAALKVAADALKSVWGDLGVDKHGSPTNSDESTCTRPE
jgi:hypothetical protein